MLEATVVGKDERAIAVEVVDHQGHTHAVLFTWDGELKGHLRERFPGDVEPESDESRILRRVRRRARYEAHYETDGDLVSNIGDPAVIKDAIDIIEGLDPAAFREQFRPFYEIIKDPPEDESTNEIMGTLYLLHLDETRSEIVGRAGPAVFYHSQDEIDYTDFSLDREPDVMLTLPPCDPGPTCGEKFRAILVHHLKCRIRDQYYLQSRKPPERYRVDGIGVNRRDIVPFEDQAK